jgi:hypothetical protein
MTFIVHYVPHKDAEWHSLTIEKDTFRNAEETADNLAADGEWFTWYVEHVRD